MKEVFSEHGFHSVESLSEKDYYTAIKHGRKFQFNPHPRVNCCWVVAEDKEPVKWQDPNNSSKGQPVFGNEDPGLSREELQGASEKEALQNCLTALNKVLAEGKGTTDCCDEEG